MKRFFCFFAIMVCAICGPQPILAEALTAPAEVRQVSEIDGPEHFSPSSNDLANQGQSTLLSITGPDSAFGGRITAINDGNMNDFGTDLSTTANSYVPSAEEQVIVEFDISEYEQGYDIFQIAVYSAYCTDRVTQNYDIDIMSVGSTEWIPIFSGYDLGRDVQPIFNSDSMGRELKVLIQDNSGQMLGMNVWQIQFTFHDTNGFGAYGGSETVYREIDVIGTPSSVPEPTTGTSLLILLTVGLGLTLKKRFFRRIHG